MAAASSSSSSSSSDSDSGLSHSFKKLKLHKKAKKAFKEKHRYVIESNNARGKFLNVHGASYDNGAKIIVRGANSRCKMHVL